MIFFRLPRGPYPSPQPPPHNDHSSVRQLASQPGVILDDEHYFDSLERPGVVQGSHAFEREGQRRIFEHARKARPRIAGAAAGEIDAVLHAPVFRIPRGRTGAVLRCSTPSAEVYSAGRQLLLLHELEPKFIALLLTLTAIDYTAALWIERSEGRRRKLFLIIGLAGNLELSGIFQVLQFSGRQFRRAARPAATLLRARDHSAAGHQLSHLPEHVLHHRRLSRPAETHPQSHRLRAVHRIFPAAGGRTHRPRRANFSPTSIIGSAQTASRSCAAFC